VGINMPTSSPEGGARVSKNRRGQESKVKKERISMTGGGSDTVFKKYLRATAGRKREGGRGYVGEGRTLPIELQRKNSERKAKKRGNERRGLERKGVRRGIEWGNRGEIQRRSLEVAARKVLRTTRQGR